MELRHIYELWDRFDSSVTVELELEIEGAHLHLRKAENNSVGSKGPDPLAKKTPGPDPLAKKVEKEPENEGGSVPLADIKSPLAGTFYRQSSPDAKPFVEVGMMIHKGDVIGIVEAMKLMNEVTATADGLVAEIPAENGALVEYNQVLIRVQENRNV